MPRKPEPWYMARRKAWFVQVDRKQVKLGDDPDPSPKSNPRPPAAVTREYYRVLGAKGLSTEADRLGATVREACEMFLESKAGLRATSVDKYQRLLEFFAAATEGRPFRSVRKEDIVRAAQGRTRWSETTRHQFVKVVGVLFTWARNAGYLDFNPLAGWNNPYEKRARTRGMTDAEFTALVDSAGDEQFKQMMLFLRGTGCRPGEMCAAEARHVHPDRPLVVLEAALHKTGRRTGKPRVLVMPSDVEAMVRSLARRFPSGPIFRNTAGRRWRPPAVQKRVKKYRRLLGLPEDLVPYLARHAALSRLLDGGTDAHLAAKIAGHADTATLQNTYYHPDIDLMIAAANKANTRETG